MSDDDEQVFQTPDDVTTNSRRLAEIKSRLQTLTREKNRYNEEKLKQDEEFSKSEIRHLREAVNEANNTISLQANKKRNLNAEMTNFKSKIGLRHSTLSIAIKEKENFRKELAKKDKTETYRNLAQQNIASIDAAIPHLEKLEEYKALLRQAETLQENARKSRELLEEILRQNLRKQTETQRLLEESKSKLPAIEKEIAELRDERDKMLTSKRKIKSKSQKNDCRSGTPVAEGNPLELEHISYQQQLDKVLKLKDYFQQKMVEHQIHCFKPIDITPISELTSPLFQPILSNDGNVDDQSSTTDTSTATSSPSTAQSAFAVAMRLPRNFAPLEFQAISTNEIIRSPHCPDTNIEYKKELPSDIVNKYGGVPKKNRQTSLNLSSTASNSNRSHRNRKNFGMKHSQQIISLYNDVRTTHGNSDAFPSMPMFEYDLIQTVQSLEMVENSIRSYLDELLTRNPVVMTMSNRDEFEHESNRDSLLDTFSESSSMIDPVFTVINNQNSNDENDVQSALQSSSSSDDKKTVVSTSTSSTRRSYSNIDQSLANNEVSLAINTTFVNCTQQLHINSIDRQISDEGYRSVVLDQQRSTTLDSAQLPLIQPQTYNSTEKVDQWLTSTSSILVPSSSATASSMETLSTYPIDTTWEFTGTNQTDPVNNI